MRKFILTNLSPPVTRKISRRIFHKSCHWARECFSVFKMSFHSSRWNELCSTAFPFHFVIKSPALSWKYHSRDILWSGKGEVTLFVLWGIRKCCYLPPTHSHLCTWEIACDVRFEHSHLKKTRILHPTIESEDPRECFQRLQKPLLLPTFA